MFIFYISETFTGSKRNTKAFRHYQVMAIKQKLGIHITYIENHSVVLLENLITYKPFVTLLSEFCAKYRYRSDL